MTSDFRDRRVRYRKRQSSMGGALRVTVTPSKAPQEAACVTPGARSPPPPPARTVGGRPVVSRTPLSARASSLNADADAAPLPPPPAYGATALVPAGAVVLTMGGNVLDCDRAARDYESGLFVARSD